MKPSEVRELPLRAARLAPLEPVTLATAERFRSIVLVADSPDTCRVARRTGREVVRDWDLTVSTSDLELCVSELVANAVHHATPDGRLTAFGGERHIAVAYRAWSHWLFVEVTDQDSTPPMLPVGELLEPELSRLRADDVLPDSGRGLFLVQSIADAVWWSPRDAGGKSVFCRFDMNRRNPR
ncbi:ATP-binding protein [Streptomyces sp. HNM0575]|uniref:ATP-binding protein n=1 Tax=Streptomyces sp. HNM0575 TaxID=2716338 RepID=UPI00145F7CB4|nr:ATP-binding protein [Streptomyces sp. HNM0575]NLU76152.1 ATP-binding protein [Streptomyces sp. HNM0575]